MGLDESWTMLTNSSRQIQSATAVGDDAYNGMLDCFRKIIKNEGSASSYAILSQIAH